MVKKAPVGRPRAGKTRKDRSRAAAYAHFAARLHGWKHEDYDQHFARDIGVAFRESEARKSARALRQQLAPRHVYKNWLLIDEDALGLETVLIRFPPSDAHNNDVMNALRLTEGIRQVVKGEVTGAIAALGLVRDRRERQDLRARIGGFAPAGFGFEPVLFETHEPALRTWRGIAHREAADEEQLA
jgi:hypothetical protein